LENQADRPERRVEQSRRALEQLQRAQVDDIAERRRQNSERKMNSSSRDQTANRELPSRRPEGLERDLQEKAGKERSADEIAAIRVSRSSELLRDAMELRDQPVHRRNYEEFRDCAAKGDLEKGPKLESGMVRSDQIAPLSITAPEQSVNSESFWHHHGNGPEYYRKMGEAYPRLHEQLKTKTPEELRHDPEFKDSVDFWYGNPPLKLDRFKDSYFCDSSGQHRVALAHRFHLEEIPSQEVREWNFKRQGEK